MDGTDEENCDEVEMNECEQNEFRCQNGLCIPEEYWVDGKLRIFMKSTHQTVTVVTTAFYNTFTHELPNSNSNSNLGKRKRKSVPQL
jgi:hypothetical protein